jgi:hypothetical protein
MEAVVIVLLGIVILMGAIVQGIAKDKGIGNWDYFIAGALFFPIALIAVLLIPRRTESGHPRS